MPEYLPNRKSRFGHLERMEESFWPTRCEKFGVGSSLAEDDLGKYEVNKKIWKSRKSRKETTKDKFLEGIYKIPSNPHMPGKEMLSQI